LDLSDSKQQDNKENYIIEASKCVLFTRLYYGAQIKEGEMGEV
jgi:hypothetical protein